MANTTQMLDLTKIPEVVGESGRNIFKRCYHLLSNTRWPVYIVGPSGSGKSIIAMNIAKKYSIKNKVPAYYVQLSPEQTKTNLILGLRLENGSIVVKNGIVADCMEKGGIIIVDEATHSMQEVLLMFNSILDRTSVTAIGDKIIYASDKFRIIFCANDSQYAGNIKLPQSFAQRLVSFYFDYPGFDDELNITDKIVDDECELEDQVPMCVKRYIVDLMRRSRSNTFPLSVRNAAIAIVMCNIEYAFQKNKNKLVDNYFVAGMNVESVRRRIAEGITNKPVQGTIGLNSDDVVEFTRFVSQIGIDRFKEIILQSFMYYLDIDLGLYDMQQTKDKIKAQIL